MLPFLGYAVLVGLGAVAVNAISKSIEEDNKELTKWEIEFDKKELQRQREKEQEIRANAERKMQEMIKQKENTYNENLNKELKRQHELNEIINRTLNT